MLFKNANLSPEAKELVDRKETLKEILKPTGTKDRDYRRKCEQELKEVKKKLAKLKNSPAQNGRVIQMTGTQSPAVLSVSSKRF